MWSAWGGWNKCSKTCSGGWRQRSRTCTNPKPKYPGQNCDGKNFDTENCNPQICPVHG